MKVGVLQFFSWPGRKGEIEAVYTRALDRIEIMDRTGYDAVWLAEHHFNAFSVCPSVTMMGAQVAARTERLRIGTAGTLAGLHHPLHLAEQLAFLDVISGGRLNWGAARGFDATEFSAFGVDGRESASKFREHVMAVIAAWSDERASFDGEYVSFDNIELLPKPAQRPGPPTWMAVSSPSSITWAAENGFPILMDPHSSHVEIARKRAIWASTMAGAGHETDADIPIARLVAVADSDEKAEAVARRGAQWMLGSYVGAGRRNVVAKRDDAPMDLSPDVDPVDRYIEQVMIWGSPAKVIDELTELEATMPLDYLMAAPLSGQSFDLLTEHIVPALAS